jgi:hypothetical protein
VGPLLILGEEKIEVLWDTGAQISMIGTEIAQKIDVEVKEFPLEFQGVASEGSVTHIRCL